MRHHVGPDVWKRLTVVPLSIAGSSLLASALTPFLQDKDHFLPFILAVIVSSWYGGLIPGLAATILSFIVADYFFMARPFDLLPRTADDFAWLALFLVVGASISLLQSALSRTNAALREVNQRFDLAANQAKIGFYEFLSLEGKVIWTPQMESLFGLASGTFEGTYEAWMKRIHQEDRNRVESIRRQCIEERRSESRHEYRALLPDGRVRWIEGRSYLFFSESGSLKRIVGANIDVTERHELEVALMERSTELTRSNEELQRFAHVVAHDLQEPLRTIGLFSELFMERSKTLLDKESLQLLDFVLSGVDRMQGLIQDILEFATVGQEPGATNMEVDTHSLAKLVLQNLRKAIDETGAVVSVESLPTVHGNDKELSRLFQNLVGNAIKYRGENTPEIHISASLNDGEWVFSVKDNGIGIDPLYHDKIFETFQRLHGASHPHGTGLGLAICKRIVEQHKGRIWVESQQGLGSTFYFTIQQSERHESSETHELLERKPNSNDGVDIQGRAATG